MNANIANAQQHRRRMIHHAIIHNIAILYLFGPWPESTAPGYTQWYIIRKITSDYIIGITVQLALAVGSSHIRNRIEDMGDSALPLLCYGMMALMTATELMLIDQHHLTFFIVDLLMWSCIIGEAIVYVLPFNVWRLLVSYL